MPDAPSASDWEALRAAEARYLASLQTPVVAHDMTIDGESLHFLEAGSPSLPTLVMVHGRGGCAALFGSVLPLLAPHRHIVAVDMPGWGLSTRMPFTGATALDAVNWWRDGVLRVVDALSLDRFDLLGHSLGGMIAMNMALARPHKIDHLVLEDSAGFPGTIPFAVRLYFYYSPERLATLATRGAFDFFSNRAAPGPRENPSQAAAMRDLTYRLTTFPGTNVSGVRAFNKILDLRGAHYTIADLIPKLTVPTRLIWGERDGVIPIRVVRDGIEALPESDLVVLPKLGHSPHIEDPQAFSRVALEFLARGRETPVV